MALEDSKPAVGRPPGSLKDSAQSLKRELNQWLSVMTKARGMVERQLDLFEKQISAIEKRGDAGFDVDQLLSIMSGLRDLMGTSIRLVESGVKLDVGDTEGKRSTNSQTDIQGFLEGGKGG